MSSSYQDEPFKNYEETSFRKNFCAVRPFVLAKGWLLKLQHLNLFTVFNSVDKANFLHLKITLMSYNSLAIFNEQRKPYIWCKFVSISGPCKSRHGTGCTDDKLCTATSNLPAPSPDTTCQSKKGRCTLGLPSLCASVCWHSLRNRRTGLAVRRYI